MKRLLFIVFTITPLFVCAQKYSVRRYQDRIIAAQAQARDSIMKSLNITASGAYEKTDTIPDCLLFKRVFDASCEWAKTDSRVNAEIDYYDKENGVIIYKGRISTGFKNVLLGDGWDCFSDFSLKIQCKNKYTQIVFSTPAIIEVYNRSGLTIKRTIEEFISHIYEVKGKKREREDAILNEMVSSSNDIINALKQRLKRE